MNEVRLRLPVFGAILLLATGCERDVIEPESSAADSVFGPGTVASVDGEAIPESVFRLYALSQYQRNADELTEQERQIALDDLINVKLFELAAKQEGLPEERRIAAELELQRMRLLANAMATRFLERNPATDSELRAAYEEHLPRLSNPQYKARHILLPSESEAAAVIERLTSGADFVELEREYAVGPNNEEAGDLGWFSLDSTVQPFADAIRGMEVGSFSTSPVRTRFGWHVILLENTREPQPPTMEEIRGELESVVERGKLEGLMERLREEASVEVN